MHTGILVALAALSIVGVGAVAASGVMAPAQNATSGMQGGYGGGMMGGGSGMYGGGMMGGGSGGCGCQNYEYCQQYMYDHNYTWENHYGMMP